MNKMVLGQLLAIHKNQIHVVKDLNVIGKKHLLKTFRKQC